MRAVTERFLPRNSPPVTPMVMMSDRDVKADRRPMMVIAWRRADGSHVNRRWTNRSRTIEHRSWMVNHGRGLIDYGRLLYDYRLGVNDGRLRSGSRLRNDVLSDDRLSLHHRSRLIDDRSGIHVNGWRSVNDRLRLESFREEQSRSDSNHDFTRGGPLFVTGLQPRSGNSDEGQCCDCH
jgi:hypothetical protein